MSNQNLQSTIITALLDACNIFRGTVNSSDYHNYILSMLFLKYISDVWTDQQEELSKKYPNTPRLVGKIPGKESFVVPKSAHFETLFKERNKTGNGTRIDKALHTIEEKNGDKLKDIFSNVHFNPDRLGQNAKGWDNLMRKLLEVFHQPALDLRPSHIGDIDIIGNAYEELIKDFSASNSKRAGEFYTPPEVSQLLARLVNPQPGNDICDPTCGSASLLLQCTRLIKKEHPNDAHCSLYGQELSCSIWAYAEMNMILHNVKNYKIAWGNTLADPKFIDKHGNLKKFDVVIANPPFSLRIWGHEGIENDRFNRFADYATPPRTKGDYALILHMLATLKESDGRMGVIVPHGVLFRGSSEGKIRQKIVENNYLDAVIGLPGKLFFGTNIPAAILVFRKNRKTEDTIFIDASRDYRSEKNQNKITTAGIDKIVDVYRQRQDVDKYAHVASRNEIKENDFNLNIPRYIDTSDEEPIDLQKVLNNREKVKQRIDVLEQNIAGYLQDLGYAPKR